MVGEPERNSADHAAVVGELEVAADQAGMARERGLRNRAEAQRLGRQHEIADIGPAIDRAINPERFGAVDNGDMRCAEEVVILQRLPGIGGLVAARDTERIVKLEAALAAALEIDPEIFPRRREIMTVFGTGSGRRINQLAKTLLGCAACDQHLPRLAVAPRRRALRHGENMLDGGARHRVGPERTNRITLVQQLFQYADAVFGRVARPRRLCRDIGHLHRPLVGILLNGTSLSTRMSPGRPSTRSAMMLRRISSLPPAIRIDGELKSICRNGPCATSSSAPVSAPAAPSNSIANIAMSCSIEPATS